MNFCTSNTSGRHCNLRFVPRYPDVLSHFTRSSPSTPKLGPNQTRHLSGRAWQGNSEKQWCEALSSDFLPGGHRRPQTNPSYARVGIFHGNQHGTTFLELPEKSERNGCTSNASGRHYKLRFVPRDPGVLNVLARSSLSTPKLGPNQGRHLSGRA